MNLRRPTQGADGQLPPAADRWAKPQVGGARGRGGRWLALAAAAITLMLGSASAPSQDLSEPAGQVKARNHPSYQVFAARLKLPAMTVAETGVIQIGAQIRLELANLGQLTATQRQALADALEIPRALADQFMARLAVNRPEPAAATNVLSALRTLVTDYRYLQDWWTRFTPPPRWQSLKVDALQSLAAGELARVWELYLALPRPAAPKAVRS